MAQEILPKACDLSCALKILNGWFCVGTEDMLKLAGSFRQAMLDGLDGHQGPLKMYPSFLNTPTGEETGLYLSVDFGGTNIRVYLVELLGRGQAVIKKGNTFLLKDPILGYDYTSNTATGTELFDFLAAQIEDLADSDVYYPLGHTFSFPSRLEDVNKAFLIKWTKEIRTNLVEGRDINLLLSDALERRGLYKIKPVAVINDTVSTLLTAAYSDPNADIGSICGTGHNTCYLESKAPGTNEAMIINIESGNFDCVNENIFDQRLDRDSQKPGEQRLEKMVSGRYLGELMRLIIYELTVSGHLFEGRRHITLEPYSLDTENISRILADDSQEMTGVGTWLKESLGIQAPAHKEMEAIRSIATLLTERSARLVATSYLGILLHIDPGVTRDHTIAIDGTLYEKMPGYSRSLKEALDATLQDKAGRVKVKLIKEGSGIGAAVAASMAVKCSNKCLATDL